MSRHKQILRHSPAIALIITIAILAVMPMLLDCRLGGHDIIYHQIYSRVFGEQLWGGEIYPRWMTSMNAGFGSPTFFYYAPLPYFFSSLFTPLIESSRVNCSSLGLGSALALVVSGVTAWIFLKTFVHPINAFFAAVVYMVLPYHLSIDLYGRAAYAEFWSFAWMPLVLYFVNPALRGSAKGFVGLSGSLACLNLTHLPSFIIFFPLFLGYSIMCAMAHTYRPSFVRLLAAIALASGLSAVYWLPAVTTQEWISRNAIRDGFYNYANNFLFEGPIIGGDDLRQFTKAIERSTILTLAAATLAWAVVRLHPRSQLRKYSGFFIVAAGVSTFLMLPVSKSVWPILIPLQRIQFPWRINILLVLIAACLVAFALDSITSSTTALLGRTKKRHLALSWLFLIALLIYVLVELAVLRGGLWHGEAAALVRILRFTTLFICIGLLPRLMTRPSLISGGRGLVLASWICLILAFADQNYKSIFTSRIDFSDQGWLSTYQAAAEHRPRWVPERQFEKGTLAEWSAKAPLIGSTDRDSRGQVLEWRPRFIALRTSTLRPARFEIKQFYYPGWSARLRENGELLPVRPSSMGLLEITVPAGDRRVDITLDPLATERIGIILTVYSIFASAFILIRHFPLTAAKRSIGDMAD